MDAAAPSLQLLGALPSVLTSLAQQAQQHAAQLAAQHQLAPLGGLPALLGLPDSSMQLHGGGLAASTAAAAAAARFVPCQRGRRSLAEAVGLPALPCGGAAGQAGASGTDMQGPGRAHAAHVLAGFWAKLRGSHRRGAGTTAAGQGESSAHARQVGAAAAGGVEGGDVEGGEVGEAELVEGLIREATSEGNLARMYEGWSAWL